MIKRHSVGEFDDDWAGEEGPRVRPIPLGALKSSVAGSQFTLGPASRRDSSAAAGDTASGLNTVAAARPETRTLSVIAQLKEAGHDFTKGLAASAGPDEVLPAAQAKVAR